MDVSFLQIIVINQSSIAYPISLTSFKYDANMFLFVEGRYTSNQFISLSCMQHRSEQYPTPALRRALADVVVHHGQSQNVANYTFFINERSSFSLAV